MKKIYNKLIRDRIPEIIRADNAEPKIRELSEEEYLQALKDKIVEEAVELQEESDKDRIITEMTDVYEVLRSLAAAYDMTLEAVSVVADKKKSERGGFEKRLFLESVEE